MHGHLNANLKLFLIVTAASTCTYFFDTSYFFMAYVMAISRLNNLEVLFAENNVHFCKSLFCHIIITYS